MTILKLITIAGVFPVLLLLSTLATLAVSWFITKVCPARYFFGLAATKQANLPGEKLRGFLPLVVMSVLFVLATILANSLVDLDSD